ncbi:MAG: biotin/lipoyl-binding protein [Planctomycetia bacterium]|nr:biotin/lipoyl-binding protein [Planctomycetia bacterium]
MNWLRKSRPVLLIIGLGLAIGSLLGARALTNGSDDSSAKQEHALRTTGGPVVLGTVDTDPPMVDYGLPPVLQSGTIKEVFVKDGDEVQAGKELYAFEDRLLKADVARAKAAIEVAKTKVNQAKELAKQHDTKIEAAKKEVEFAKTKVDLNATHYDLVDKNLEKFYRTEKIPEADWKESKRTDPTLYRARVDWQIAVNELKLAEVKLKALEAMDPQVQVKEADAVVKQAEEELEKAQAAVDLCVVKAKTAGTIEQVSISPGTTIGIGTRTPALWLIPAGPRVVRAEVEADFAHRVGSDLKGKTVTIYDHTDNKLTYSGTVTRISTSFLRKRTGGENLLGNDTRVIEVVVEVSDHAPPGKPPLRVGQRVRVNLGQ